MRQWRVRRVCRAGLDDAACLSRDFLLLWRRCTHYMVLEFAPRTNRRIPNSLDDDRYVHGVGYGRHPQCQGKQAPDHNNAEVTYA